MGKEALKQLKENLWIIYALSVVYGLLLAILNPQTTLLEFSILIILYIIPALYLYIVDKTSLYLAVSLALITSVVRDISVGLYLFFVAGYTRALEYLIYLLLPLSLETIKMSLFSLNIEIPLIIVPIVFYARIALAVYLLKIWLEKVEELLMQQKQETLIDKARNIISGIFKSLSINS